MLRHPPSSTRTDTRCPYSSLFRFGLAPEWDPRALTAFVDDYACEALSMTQADDDAQTVAASLISEAGGVSPLKGYLVAMEPDGVMSIVLAFEDDDQAERNLDSRRALAGAEDPGDRKSTRLNSSH